MVIELTRKKVLIFISLLVVLVAVPLTVYLSQRQQDTRSRASQEVPDSTVVATIDGEQITKGDLREVAEEYYEPDQVDSQALNDALEILIERKILDEEGLNASPAEIAAKEETGLSGQDAYYEVIKDKVILSQVRSRQALTIDFWSPTDEDLADLTDEEKTEVEKQLADGIPALREIETVLRGDPDVISAVNALLNKYPSLKEVLAVNGYIFDSLDESEKETILEPQIFEYSDSPLDTQARDELFGMQEGEVKLVLDTTTNRGGVLFKVVSVGNDQGTGSYFDWLEQRRAESVNIVPNVI